MNNLLDKIVEQISSQHHKILDDWCKAYLAKEYELNQHIHPGCYTIIEQVLAYPQIGNKYFIRKNTKDEFLLKNLELAPWIDVNNSIPDKGNNVWVYTECDQILFAYVIDNEDFLWFSDEIDDYVNVLAWKPVCRPSKPCTKL